MGIRQSWIIPVILLIVLLGAWHFRWEVNATQTRSLEYQGIILTYIYKTDHWTGNHWVVYYSQSIIGYEGDSSGVEYAYLKSGHRANALQTKAIWAKRNNTTRIWWGLFGLSLVWLITAIFVQKKYVNNKGRE